MFFERFPAETERLIFGPWAYGVVSGGLLVFAKASPSLSTMPKWKRTTNAKCRKRASGLVLKREKTHAVQDTVLYVMYTRAPDTLAQQFAARETQNVCGTLFSPLSRTIHRTNTHTPDRGIFSPVLKRNNDIHNGQKPERQTSEWVSIVVIERGGRHCRYRDAAATWNSKTTVIKTITSLIRKLFVKRRFVQLSIVNHKICI